MGRIAVVKIDWATTAYKVMRWLVGTLMLANKMNRNI